jgi:hypothetical protein
MSHGTLNVTLTCAAGPVGTAGRLVLALRLAGIAGFATAGTVAERDSGFRDFTPSADDVRALAAMAEGLDFARVEARVDTSDTWHEIVLHVNGRTLALAIMASGFQGEGADALRRFFARLLASAGVRDESLRVQLTGEPTTPSDRAGC